MVDSWDKLNAAVQKRKKGFGTFEQSSSLSWGMSNCSRIYQNQKRVNQYTITDSVSELEQTLRNHERTHQEVKCYSTKIDQFRDRADEINDTKCSQTNESLQAMFADVMSSFAQHETDIRDALRKARFENDKSNMIEMIQERTMPENAARAELAIQEHTRRKVEIDLNNEKVDKLVTKGEAIYATDKCEALKTCLANLTRAWDDKQTS